MKRTVTYRRLERNVIPPRCRNPRDVTHTETVDVDIAEVTSAQAPVAFEVTNYTGGVTSYRLHNGALYTPHLPWAGQTEPTLPGSVRFPAEVTDTWAIDKPAEEARAAAEARQVGQFLIVDGVVYRRSTEPRYSVMTFGLGNNHGGTGLMIDTYDKYTITDPFVFAADQYEAARSYALKVAEGRGDTDDLPRFADQAPAIRVLLPDAVTPCGSAAVAS